MTAPPRDPAAELAAARAELTAATSALARAEAALERAVEGVANTPFNAPSPTAPITEHRRLHRPGRPGKIASDPELRAFIEARLDRHTFAEIAAVVAEHFPPERRVGRSAIHAWTRSDAARAR